MLLCLECNMSSIGSSLNPINFLSSSMSAEESNDGCEILLAIEKAEYSFMITELVKKSQHFKPEIFEKIIRAALKKECVDTSALFEFLLTSKINEKVIREISKEFYKSTPTILKNLKFKVFISSFNDSDKKEFVNFIFDNFLEKDRVYQYEDLTNFAKELIKISFRRENDFLVPIALKCAEYIPECIAIIEIFAKNIDVPPAIGLTKQQFLQFLDIAFASKKIMRPTNNNYLRYLKVYKNEFSQIELVEILKKSLNFCNGSVVLDAADDVLENDSFYGFITSSGIIGNVKEFILVGTILNRKNSDAKVFSLMFDVFSRQPSYARDKLISEYLKFLELNKNAFSQEELFRFLRKSLELCNFWTVLKVANAVLNDEFFNSFIVSCAAIYHDEAYYTLNFVKKRGEAEPNFFPLMFDFLARRYCGNKTYIDEIFKIPPKELENRFDDKLLFSRAIINILLQSDSFLKFFQENFPAVFKTFPKVTSLLVCQNDISAFLTLKYPTDTSPLQCLWQMMMEETNESRKLDLFQFCMCQELRYQWFCELYPNYSRLFKRLYEQIANIQNMELKSWAASLVSSSLFMEHICVNWAKAIHNHKDDHALLPFLLALIVNPQGISDLDNKDSVFGNWMHLYGNLSRRHKKNKDFLLYTLDFFKAFNDLYGLSPAEKSHVLHQMFYQEENVALRIRIITTLLRFGSFGVLKGEEIIPLVQLRSHSQCETIQSLNINLSEIRDIQVIEAIESKLFGIRVPNAFPTVCSIVNSTDHRMTLEQRTIFKEAFGKFVTSILTGKYKEQRYATSPHLQKLLELSPKNKEILRRWRQPSTPSALQDYIPKDTKQKEITFRSRYIELLRDRLIMHNHIPDLHKRLPFVAQYLEGTLTTPIDKLEGLDADILHACIIENDKDGIDYLDKIQMKCLEFSEFKEDLIGFQKSLINAHRKQLYDGYTIHVTDEYTDLLLLAQETSGCTAIGKGTNNHCALSFPMDGTHKAIVVKPPGKNLDFTPIFTRAVIDLGWDASNREAVGILQPTYSKSADVEINQAIIQFAKEYFSKEVRVPLMSIRYNPSEGVEIDSIVEFYGSNTPFTYNDSASKDKINNGFSQLLPLKLLCRPESLPTLSDPSIIDLNEVGNSAAVESVKSINAKNHWSDHDHAIIEKYFDAKGRIYFAKIGDKIAGYVTQKYSPSKHSFLNRHFYIPYIAVDPDFHGKDIATSLMKKVKGLAENQKIKKIKLEYRGNNEKAVKFYESLPFKLNLKAKNKNIGTYTNGDPKVKLTMYLG